MPQEMKQSVSKSGTRLEHVYGLCFIKWGIYRKMPVSLSAFLSIFRRMLL